MKRLIFILAICIGCAPVTVYVPPAVIIRRHPDSRGVLKLSTKGRHKGTAVVVAHKNGFWYALTAYHCCLPPEKFEIDGHDAEVWVYLKSVDLALVRFRSIKTYPVYALRTPLPGEGCWTMGYPQVPKRPWGGIPKNLRPELHVMRGNVSWVAPARFSFTAGVMFGFSGGPIFGDDGKLLGIIQIMAPYPTFGYGVPSGEARWLLNTIS